MLPTLLDESLDQLQIIRANCAEPLPADVEKAFNRVASILEFYQERTTNLGVQRYNIQERLKKVATAAKSRNEHVLNLKKKIQEIIEMCK